MASLDSKEIEELFAEPADLEDLFSEAIDQWESCRQDNLVDRTLQFFTKLYLQDDILVKVDRASMMHSLEARAPFLDIELVDFVRRIPHTYKYRRGQTKYILKKALEPVLPRDVLYRSKQGFGVPIGKWFRESVFDLVFRSDLPMKTEYARFLAALHAAGRSDERAFLWNYWVLSKWLVSPARTPETSLPLVAERNPT